MKIIFKSKKELAALNIISKLQKEGYQAYMVGGYIRDKLLHIDKPSHMIDIDIATNATPQKVITLFKNTKKVGLHFAVVLVNIDSYEFEVATFRSDNEYQNGRHPLSVSFPVEPQKDALRRDFTINAIFYDPISEKLIDYVKGKQDLKIKTIRAIGLPEKRFNEDFLRMLRAIRFAGQISFQIEGQTLRSIAQNSHRIIEISAERILDEIKKMFSTSNIYLILDYLTKTNILSLVIPEIKIEKVKDIINKKQYRDILSNISSSSFEIMMAYLFYISEPNIFEHKLMNNKKEKEIKKSLNDLKVSKKSQEKIILFLKGIFYAFNFKKLTLGEQKIFLGDKSFLSQKEFFNFFSEMHSSFNQNFLAILIFKEKLKNDQKSIDQIKPLLTGQDLLNEGFKPGPEIKKNLDTLWNLQLNEKIKNRQEALKYLHQLSTKKKD